MENALKRSGEGPSVWVVGDLYTIKASGAETGGAFTQIEVSVPPGSGPPPHVHHREDEAFYVIEGEFEVHVDDEVLTANTGDWVTLAKESLHSFRNIGESVGRMLILATPAGLDDFFLEAGRTATDTSLDSATVTEEDKQRLLDISPKYGIDIKAPRES
ncbi:cupin domain-containing protein [Thalassoglobus polymorphus]|uniref:Quercetin 2,3-dioxygenase n=1 Tax=Thalassoglobus polymorphus TaxID=2527994 RepID=A0A517QJF5_9PLAN|nr:cupin domain-containing protein [Thalassoglobus polymorphus]QDT31687.1 Quercetin 2,3-dioxygenase [Thalassoglobus polymorphus]